MANDRLKIVETSNSSAKLSSQELARQRCEREWKDNPKKLSPSSSAIHRERIVRTLALIKEFFDPKDKIIADVGCGDGTITAHFASLATHIDALDIAQNALDIINKDPKSNVKTWRAALPTTPLKDSYYDLVICGDVIAEMPPSEHRLLMAELARLVKPEGLVVCSTPLDIHSDSPFQRFEALAQTEFTIVKWVISHNSLYIRLCGWLKAPHRFYRAWKDKDYRGRKIAERSAVSKGWFILNSTFPLAPLWHIIQFATDPMLKKAKQSQGLLLFLEKIARFLNFEKSISHAIFLGKRRPLQIPTETSDHDLPILRGKKERKWE